MSRVNIVIQLKGTAKPVSSEWMEKADAERLLQEEVLPKIGTSQAISLPGLVVTGVEVISARTNHPPSIG